MRGELKELQRRTGITFVYVTHDQAEALALSDQIAVMHGGRLQQYGTPQEVYARPANRMVADFMGLVNLCPARCARRRTAAARSRLGGGPRRSCRGARRAPARRQRRRRRSGPRTSASARAGPARERQRGEDHRAHVSSATSSSIMRRLDVGPDASGTDPSAAGLRGRRRGRGRGRRHANAASSARRRRRRACYERKLGVVRMNKPVSPAPSSRARSTGPTRATSGCSCGRSAAGDPPGPAARSCSCTARRWPRSRPSTCRCRAPTPRAMDYFAARGFDTWCVDMEGYGRSTKHRDINCHIADGADDLAAATDYIVKTARQAARSWSTASRRARCARRCSRSAIPTASTRLALDAFVWTGEGSPTLAERSKKLPEFRAKNRRPIDRNFVRSIFERDHPGTADDNVIEAFADAILALDDSMPNGTYIDMCTNLPVVDPDQDHGADHRHARPVRRHRRPRRPAGVLREAAEPGQAVRRDARHRARLLPAEELRDLLSHPGELLLAAGADLQGAATEPQPGRAPNNEQGSERHAQADTCARWRHRSCFAGLLGPRPRAGRRRRRQGQGRGQGDLVHLDADRAGRRRSPTPSRRRPASRSSCSAPAARRSCAASSRRSTPAASRSTC